jgi:hypothetical protein
VRSILARCNPFKVVHVVVMFVGILVIHLSCSWRSLKESFRDKPVHVPHSPRYSPEPHAQIASSTARRTEQPPSIWATFASNTTVITDAPKAIPKRNRSPFFQVEGKLGILRVHRKGYSFRCHGAGRPIPSRLPYSLP